MTEREIFMQALDRASPVERAAFLDAACGGDPALRDRVESLLRSHEGAGEFLAGSAPERLAGGPPVGPGEDATRTGPAPPDADDGLDFLDPSDKPDSLGRLGHYEVRAVVGRGGMGVVLMAFDEQLHRVVAIKVMAPQLATSATARKRFVREARAQAAVSHDHVVTIHAVDDAGPLPHIVMQFVAGQSLQDRLDRAGPLPLAEVLRIGMQTASGLAAAHAQGLVHRDVKPANILLENGVERVKLTDFGLARAADDASLTQSGTVAGTPAFMSPEQAEGKPVDRRSDLFSLGSVLYAMCTGRPPFRAGTSMAVLKRVCEDTPTPVREANPEVPDWLADVIGKLHAKDPAERYPSAAEVAETLGRHLAHLQHPSRVPLPAVRNRVERPLEPDRPARRTRWAVAAAAIVAGLALLGAAEAAGVTGVRAAVVRFFTPDGTLVVEADDPAVKVVIEGDGDLVITGAGPQEVRLKAGSYRLKATRDGKAVRLDRDLVAISRGDRQIVRVRLEDDTPAAVAPRGELGAFVLLGGNGVAERRFDTLAEAVRSASSGDTVEVRGNGPFVTAPVNLAAKALTIRAAEGFRPAVQFQPRGPDDAAPLLATDAPLVLEGLVFRGDLPSRPGMLRSSAPLHLASCRFIGRSGGQRRGPLVLAHNAPRVTLRNCEFLGYDLSGAGAVRWNVPSAGRLSMENCCGVDGRALRVSVLNHDPKDVSIHLARNTWVTKWSVLVLAQERPVTVPRATAEDRLIRWATAANVFDSEQSVLNFNQAREGVVKAGDPPPPDAEALLARMGDWREEKNAYAVSGYLTWSVATDPTGGLNDLVAWNRFWKLTGTGSAEGRTRFHGGDLRAKTLTAPESVGPDDFRLRPDSAGYRAGQGSKDLGADVDLVGPGPAYGRWKQTPDYRRWLEDTGQVKK